LKARRPSKLLVEPASSASGDIAFNLIVFFLVCASVQPDSGRKQVLPRSEQNEEQKQEIENIEVQLTRGAALINGTAVNERLFKPQLKRLFSTRPRSEDRVVVVRSKKDTPYHIWIRYTEMIEEAGGVITIQTEEEQTVILPN